ncbi:unnamed protein product [Camellia sinensis]
MAESVVAFAIKGLGVLVIQNAQFLYGMSDQVEQVQAHLRQMQCFLKDADAKQDEHEMIHNLVAEIREVAYNAEAVVETFVFEVASRRGGFRKILIRSVNILSEVLARYRIQSEIETIKKNVNILISSLQSYGLIAVMEREGISSTYQRKLQFRRSYSHVIEDDFVGFQEDMKTLIKHLVNERKQNCQVVAICGMGGLGKTTLAKKIYHHQSIRNHFDRFAWVCVSQQWQRKDILEGIFTKLVPERKNQIVNMRDEELVKQLYRVQQEKKCLVVIDDIWSSYAWDSLRAAFPPGTGSMGSKILITTRNKEVAMHIDPTCFLHEPKCLNEEESWELFQKKVFSRRDGADFKVDTRMEMLVREMVERCGGLPLAIVVLGGILVTKHTWSEWEIVHQNLNSFLRRGKSIGQQHGGIMEVLALSYRDLPYRLKACFLCLGNYPEDVEIEAEKLYQLWMAEGIMLPSSLVDKEKGEEETMMDVAECYLDELAQRCILQVQLEEYPIRYQGRFKSCKLHDLMRDLCLLKIKEENFLKVVHLKRHKNEQQLVENSYPSSLSSYRSSQIHRLAIVFDENVDGDLSLLKQKQVQHIRSVVFFYGGRCSHRLWEQIKPRIFNHLKLLKVLDLEAIGHRFFSVSDLKLPKAIGNLIHLRYLGLRYSWFNQLPSSIGKLRYLQTLDLQTLSHPLIPNVLWKLKLLQYLYLPHSLHIENGDILRLDGLDNLEMLENFHTYYCGIKDLFKLTNLRQLREAKMWGRREDMINYLFSISNPSQQLFRHSSLSIRDSDVFSKESNLLTQLLGCHHLHKLEIQEPIQVLAPPVDHQMNISLYSSSSLTQLWLEGSLLKEDPMSTLEKLPNLRTLHLDEAFVGEEMVCSAMGFPQLKYLKLKGLHNLVRWRVDERAMPNLLTLEIRNCKKLKMLPDELRSVLPHVQVLIEETTEECHYFRPTSPPTSSFSSVVLLKGPKGPYAGSSYNHGLEIGPYVWLTHEEVYDAALQLGSGWSFLENGAVYMDPLSQNRSFSGDTGYANMPSKVYFTSKNYCQLWKISSMRKKEAEDLSCFSWKEFALLGSLDREFPRSNICTIMYTSGMTGECKGVVLTNGTIMAEVCLQINCYLKQKKWMNLHLKITKTVALEVKTSETIKNLKAMLYEKEGISEDIRELFFTGKRLKDEDKLVGYGIHTNSTLHLVLRNLANTCDTIQNIKSLIQKNEGIQSDCYTFFYSGKLLKDNQTLVSLNIQPESIVCLVFNQRDVLSISVKMPRGEILKPKVKLLHTISDFKAIIASMVGFLGSEQHILYNGRRLEDGKT